MYLRTGNSVYGKLNTFFAETLIAINIKNILCIYIYIFFKAVVASMCNIFKVTKNTFFC